MEVGSRKTEAKNNKTTMKILFFVGLSAAIICSCLNGNNKNIRNTKVQKTNIGSDSVIGKRDISREVAGSNYIHSATEYFVVAANDTSTFRPVFVKWKQNGEITIDLNLPYTRKTETWSQRIQELKVILKKAETDYRMDSLRNIDVGRLILTGDAAVEITRKYKNRFGTVENITTADYKRISDFLIETKLTADFNNILHPYSLSVDKFSIEKAFFTHQSELFKYSKLERDTTQIPDKILDCITFVLLKKSK